MFHLEVKLFSTIWAETVDNVRSAAQTLVLGGLSDKHYALTDFWVADRINDIDTEALRILNMCYDHAKEILHQYRNLMDAVVDILVEKKSLTKEGFFKLVELHGSLQPMPPSVLDLRSAKCLSLRIHSQSRRILFLKDAIEPGICNSH